MVTKEPIKKEMSIILPNFTWDSKKRRSRKTSTWFSLKIKIEKNKTAEKTKKRIIVLSLIQNYLEPSVFSLNNYHHLPFKRITQD